MSAESRKTFDIYNILKNYKDYNIELYTSKNAFNKLILSLIFASRVKSYQELMYDHCNSDVILPVEEQDIEYLHEINYVDESRVPRCELLKSLVDKELLSEVCATAKISYPETVNLERYLNDFTLSEQQKFNFPAYLKPRRGMGAQGVKQIANVSELNSYLTNKNLKLTDYILQAEVQGDGAIEGAFVVASNGNTLAAYSHRRILTYPFNGGVTVLSESTKNDEILNYTNEIVCEAKYSGFIMIEYKYCSVQERYFVIEINPRPWGSISLSEMAYPGFVTSYIDLSRLNLDINVKKTVSWIVPHAFILLLKGRFNDARSLFFADTYIMFSKKSFLRSIIFSLYFNSNLLKIVRRVI